MQSPLLDMLEKLAERVTQGQISANAAGTFAPRLVNSPALALVLKLTPSTYDDLALEFLNAVLPPP